MGAGADAKTFGRHGCPHSGIYAWLKSAPSEDATDVTSCSARMKLAVLAVSGEAIGFRFGQRRVEPAGFNVGEWGPSRRD